MSNLAAAFIGAFPLDARVNHALFVNNKRGIDVVTGPKFEILRRLRSYLEIADVPPLDESTTVGEVNGVSANGHRVLDADVVVAHCLEQLIGPRRHVHHNLGVDGNPIGYLVIPTVEFHREPPRVLPAFEQVVVDDQRTSVPIVVMENWRKVLGVNRPQLFGLRTVEAHRSQFVITRPEIHDRKSIGIHRYRTLNNVTHRKIRKDPLAAHPVDEVHSTTERAKHHPGTGIAHKDRSLSGPPCSAPSSSSNRSHRSGG